MKGEVNDQVIHVSIPKSLWAKLQEQAKEEGRTFNGHCRYILSQSVEVTLSFPENPVSS